jgi:hypothetical protein
LLLKNITTVKPGENLIKKMVITDFLA